jgi:serine/threonine-protein kinase
MTTSAEEPTRRDRAAAASRSSSRRGAIEAAPDGAGFSLPDLPRPLGRYVLLKLLARGGMGEVYLASTTGLEGAERPVVVKVIRREHVADPSFFARFLDEARVQSQLQCSGVAQVLEAATEERSGEPYVVLEHVEGRSLAEVRARAAQLGERLGWADAVALATMIAEALGYVHERKDASGRALAIVHRDLSPQNVMVSYLGEIKIIDFGTARGENRRCHTVAGVVFAKPGYVAPEVANGDPGDARVDLYALGVILWELCMGRRFLQGDPAEHMARVARGELDPPAIADGLGAPSDLDVILARLTAFDRATRYPTGRAAASDLARLLSAAQPLPGGERSVRARAAAVMGRLFPSEPARSRREFGDLAAAARAEHAALATPVSRAAADLAKRAADEQQGLLPGTRYELVREIGRGASSVVYEARHVDLGRRAAIKVLAAEDVGSRRARDRFRREARAMSRLSHPSLVEILDYGVASDDRPFCVMELLEGETLEAMLAREKVLGPREALSIAHRALVPLAAAHEAGVVHRDVKPANLFLTRSGDVKLLDFGLATSPDDAPEPPPSVGDLAGLTIYGTPEYMAPEQAASGRVDARADVYALGCVLYEMMTGSLPFVRASSVATLDAKVKGSPERARDRAAGRKIPRDVDELVMRALARHPSLRFGSAGEMRAAIDRLLASPRRSRAVRRAAALLAIAAIAAFGGLALARGGRGLDRARWEASVVAPARAAWTDLVGLVRGGSATHDEAADGEVAAPAEAPREIVLNEGEPGVAPPPADAAQAAPPPAPEPVAEPAAARPPPAAEPARVADAPRSEPAPVRDRARKRKAAGKAVGHAPEPAAAVAAAPKKAGKPAMATAERGTPKGDRAARKGAAKGASEGRTKAAPAPKGRAPAAGARDAADPPASTDDDEAEARQRRRVRKRFASRF